MYSPIQYSRLVWILSRHSTYEKFAIILLYLLRNNMHLVYLGQIQHCLSLSIYLSIYLSLFLFLFLSLLIYLSIYLSISFCSNLSIYHSLFIIYPSIYLYLFLFLFLPLLIYLSIYLSIKRVQKQNYEYSCIIINESSWIICHPNIGSLLSMNGIKCLKKLFWKHATCFDGVLIQ